MRLDAMDRLSRSSNCWRASKTCWRLRNERLNVALMNLGMSKPQLKDLARSRKLTQEIIISAPATSFVLARNITPGQKFVSR